MRRRRATKHALVMAKIVTVFGATGNQGSSVVNALLAVPGFKVRALTRTPDSSKAKHAQQRL